MTSDELQKSKARALGLVEDLFSNYVYYDRKDDEDMPLGRIEALVDRGVLQPQEIVDAFRQQVLAYFKDATRPS